jgi:imidazolonepropionase-like amidohydrolase
MLFALALIRGGFAEPRSSSTLILDHATLLETPSSSPRRDVAITIVDGQIQNVQASSEFHPASAADRVIDLRGDWVLPGLIDSHAHLYDIPSAQRMLARGITTGRSMLTTGYEDVGLKALYARGDRDLPEILATGFPVVAHPNSFVPNLSSLFLDNPDLDDLRFSERIGADGARRIVDDNAKRHVDWVKVFANGRAGVPSADPTSRDLNDEELEAAVKEATASGIPVAVHAYSDDGVSAAVKAGVRTVEHGSLITEPTVRLMLEHGVCFTPTLAPFYAHSNPAADASPDEKVLAARLRGMIESSRRAIATARSLNVAIIAGSDSEYGSDDDPTVIDEISRLAKAGLGPVQAIASATETAATCLGLERRKGSVRRGLDADLVVYAKDPRTDLEVLRSPSMVINRGSIAVDKLSKPPKS